MKTIEDWIDLDLTAAAHSGELAPAFEIDDTVDSIASVLEIDRCAVVTGVSGIGKTAAVHELARRAYQNSGPACLRGRRFVQISLRRHALRFGERHEFQQAVQKLFDLLKRNAGRLAVFLRDFGVVYEYDLEPQFATLAHAFDGPMVCEGPRGIVDALLEQEPCLQARFIAVPMEEPSFDVTDAILRQWADTQQRSNGRAGSLPAYDESAVEQALQLTHRFIARGRQPRKAIDLLTQASAHASGKTVTADEVIERFCMVHRTPRVLVDPKVPLDLGDVESRFADDVIGQPEAVESAVNLICAIKTGLSDPRRPLGVFLFVGPTGVGKTYVAQLLADFLFGSRERLIRLNMADYGHERAANVVFGDPDDYRTTVIRGLLTIRLMGHPFGVVLLDEFEKASLAVQDRFLQLFDEGQFINGASEVVSCRSMILIATSNAGAEVYRDAPIGYALDDAGQRREAAHVRVGQYLRVELLNRFDEVVHFEPLQGGHVRSLAQRELQLVEQRIGLRHRQLTLHADAQVLDWVAARGFDPVFGARKFRRTFARQVTAAVSRAILRDQPAVGSRVVLSINDDRLVAFVEQPVRHAPAVEALEQVAAPVDKARPARRFGLFARSASNAVTKPNGRSA